MNKTILFLLTFVPTILFGQDLKKINDNENNETFYVLKSDRVTKHGKYQKFSYNYKLLITGFYKHGVRDSIWECFNMDGDRTAIYNYTKNQLVYYKPTDKIKDKKFRLLNGNNNSDTTLSRTPIFLGGEDLVRSVLAKNLRYPSAALEKGKSGKVYVLFTVDKFGKVSNFHVESPQGFGMDNEAIRVLKLLPDNWLPGLLNEQPVDVEVAYPISFTLH